MFLFSSPWTGTMLKIFTTNGMLVDTIEVWQKSDEDYNEIAIPIISPNGRYMFYVDEFNQVLKGHIVEIVKPKKPENSLHVFALRKVREIENLEEEVGII